ncbi:Peptidyl-prolyl cis-trans isomerase CYP59 [Galdieria sulphuraria]|nr:Peptidyl-prolyl cis-trans isomerase CYP59 [Galdieria sulphuraria]
MLTRVLLYKQVTRQIQVKEVKAYMEFVLENKHDTLKTSSLPSFDIIAKDEFLWLMPVSQILMAVSFLLLLVISWTTWMTNIPFFGQVEEGWETVEAIESVLVDEKKKPFQVSRIYHTIILDDPFPDPPVRLDDDEIWQEEEGMDSEEREKLRRRKEAHSRAEVLEIIGDIPDAEVKPPDNTLFVCKLNPVTRSEDLELIFFLGLVNARLR